MTAAEQAYARWCVKNKPHAFYLWTRWKQVRAEVLKLDHYECQRCRSVYHRYRRASTVHHVNHLKTRPDLALEIWTSDPATHERTRNLLSLCHDCHEEVHGHRRKETDEAQALTPERWD